MAKFKLAGGRKSKEPSNRRAIPCLLIIVAGIALLSILFYLFLQGSS